MNNVLIEELDRMLVPCCTNISYFALALVSVVFCRSHIESQTVKLTKCQRYIIIDANQPPVLYSPLMQGSKDIIVS